MRKIIVALLLLLPALAWGQTDFILLKGHVVCHGKGIPYATLQLKGTSKGVTCNDAGEYMMKVPVEHRGDTMTIRSVGYQPIEATVEKLSSIRKIELSESLVVLKEVKVSDFKSGRSLLKAAVAKIPQNYHQESTQSTYFYRDWRAVDGELFLFDEAVMLLERIGYAHFDNKKSFLFSTEERELESDYKTLLKHRLLVYDRKLVKEKTGLESGTNRMLEYADNEQFFDPVYTPQANYLLADHVLKRIRFAPIKEFEDNGVTFYQIRFDIPTGSMRGEYIIRKSDLAIVKIVSAMAPKSRRPRSEEVWANIFYNRLTIEADSSLWNYDVRDGHYTLTRYYNYRIYCLSAQKRNHIDKTESWQLCTDWVLTDFSKQDSTIHNGDTLGIEPMPIGKAFGGSYYNSDYWGQYNSVVIDTLPLRLLLEKLNNTHSHENQ
ncbi:MAG: carboxypeptidase-like regulatory domain-containing protein [Bacteroidales bacterium]|nr:carboxypeptidase-like regulatory domain-containing protein [Bacteroidales bacterium]